MSWHSLFQWWFDWWVLVIWLVIYGYLMIFSADVFQRLDLLDLLAWAWLLTSFAMRVFRSASSMAEIGWNADVAWSNCVATSTLCDEPLVQGPLVSGSSLGVRHWMYRTCMKSCREPWIFFGPVVLLVHLIKHFYCELHICNITRTEPATSRMSCLEAKLQHEQTQLIIVWEAPRT